MSLRHWAAVKKDGSYIKDVILAESQQQAEILLFSNWTERLRVLYEARPVTVSIDITTSLASKSYDELFVEDFISNGETASKLNSTGLCSKTVCPNCHVDDFNHVEGCSKLKLIADI